MSEGKEKTWTRKRPAASDKARKPRTSTSKKVKDEAKPATKKTEKVEEPAAETVKEEA